MQHITICKINSIKSSCNKKKNFGDKLMKSNMQKITLIKIKEKWSNKTKPDFLMQRERISNKH